MAGPSNWEVTSRTVLTTLDARDGRQTTPACFEPSAEESLGPNEGPCRDEDVSLGVRGSTWLETGRSRITSFSCR